MISGKSELEEVNIKKGILVGFLVSALTLILRMEN